MQKYIGLNKQQVIESREKHGSNIITPPEKEPLWKKFLEKFSDPLIIVLLVAGAFSIAISFYEYFGLNHSTIVFLEPIGIFIAILLATGLAFFFEYKADKEFEILNKVNDDETVKVYRDGDVVEIAKKDIVVGDLVVLQQGDEIPADASLLDAINLQVDESTLTGEPICHKIINEAEFDTEATFASNHVMRGTKVLEGHGLCEVFAVGDSTENGKVFVESQIDNSVKTPLNEQLSRLTDYITKFSYVMAILLVAGRMFMYLTQPNFDFEWVEFMSHLLKSIMLAVTLIVVSVPEGLPMAVTLTLAYSMRRMLKTKNLVRKLHACETMGAITIICTDKTGTLTQNKMQVQASEFAEFESGSLDNSTVGEYIKEGISVNSTAVLNNHNGEVNALGNPTECALLLWLNSNGVDYNEYRSKAEKIEELSFTTENKYMASVVKSTIDGKYVLYVKGAPEIVYSLCTNSSISKADFDNSILDYQNKAMRTLGFAYKVLDSADAEVFADNKLAVSDLNFLGFVAISDPVRSDVPDAIEECVRAGIAIKIVTGDTPATAKEIARQIGLWTDGDGDDNIITGPELAALSDDELKACILKIKIIARARPMDKKRLVETLQDLNHVVSVTGDGTNDAPALKAAHVGLSMGDGTSVAKEASDITIIDNSFASIGRAVMWGRSLYKNIQRFIMFQLTINVVACLIVVIGAFMGAESPLTVTQMLWVNLIMDTFAAMALASLPPTASLMKRKPRDRNSFIISKPMIQRILGTGLLFFGILISLVWYFLHTEINSVMDIFNAPISSTLGHLSPYEISLFFTFFVLLQFWNMFNARAFETEQSAFHFKGCRGFILISFIILVGQFLIVQFGGALFSVVPLQLIDWVLLIAISSTVLFVGELVRLVGK